MSEPVQPEGGTASELARGAEPDEPIAEASHAAIGHAAEARGGSERVIVEQGCHNRAGALGAQSRRCPHEDRGAAREFAMEVDGGGGGSRIGDRHLAEFPPLGLEAAAFPRPETSKGNGIGQPSFRARTEFGEPEAQEFRAGMGEPPGAETGV